MRRDAVGLIRDRCGICRRKAIETANALLEEGYDEGKAIRIAIAKGRVGGAQRMNHVPLLALDFGQHPFFPAINAADIAGRS